jgi:hypothetical protein
MKNKNKNILFTFDYELFLGKNSGDVLNTIIIPTNKILNTLSKLNSRAIFFVDATYIANLIDYAKLHKKCQSDLLYIENQIAAILDGNHDIGLHIHPHWLDATYNSDNGCWDLSEDKKYAADSLSKEELDQIFHTSFNALNSLIKNHKPGYKINSFRAGGLCIQPFNLFRPYLHAFKIRNEFSVLRNAELNMIHYKFNFKAVPKADFYTFKEDVLIQDEEGDYVEYSINKFSLSFLAKILNSFYFRLSNLLFKTKNQGVGIVPNIDNNTNQKRGLLMYIKKPATETLSIENINITKFFSYLFYLKNSSYIHFISHPKLIRPGQLLLFYFLISILKIFGSDLNYDYEKWIELKKK